MFVKFGLQVGPRSYNHKGKHVPKHCLILCPLHLLRDGHQAALINYPSDTHTFSHMSNTQKDFENMIINNTPAFVQGEIQHCANTAGRFVSRFDRKGTSTTIKHLYVSACDFLRHTDLITVSFFVFIIWLLTVTLQPNPGCCCWRNLELQVTFLKMLLKYASSFSCGLPKKI